MYQFQFIDEYAVVTGYPDGSDWIFERNGPQGICGSERDRLWQLSPQGEVRLWDLPSRAIIGSIDLEFSSKEGMRAIASQNGNRLCVMAKVGSQLHVTGPLQEAGEYVLVDLDALKIVARHTGIFLQSGAKAVVMGDGALIHSMIGRRDGQVVDLLVRIDGQDGSVSESFVPSQRIPDSYSGIHWHSHSPDGRWWLRFDHTSFPMAEHSPKAGEPSRRYFGLTMQLWSAFPLRFVRRIVVVWLKAESLPDATHILQSWDIKPATPPPPPASSPQGSRVAGFGNSLRRVFGRRGLVASPSTPPPSTEPLDPREAAMLASVPARERIYIAISNAFHRPDSAPEGPFPDRAAFGEEAAADNAFWGVITKNLEKLVGDSLGAPPSAGRMTQRQCGSIALDS